MVPLTLLCDVPYDVTIRYVLLGSLRKVSRRRKVSRHEREMAVSEVSRAINAWMYSSPVV